MRGECMHFAMGVSVVLYTKGLLTSAFVVVRNTERDR